MLVVQGLDVFLLRARGHRQNRERAPPGQVVTERSERGRVERPQYRPKLGMLPCRCRDQTML